MEEAIRTIRAMASASGSTSGRSIGRTGTVARIVAGLAFLELGILGLPPLHLLAWWQILIGFIGLPAPATLMQLARSALTRERLRQTGGAATMINCIVLTGLLIIPRTRGITFIFLGEAMLLAALRGYGGCETLAFSNWLLRRDDQIGCILFTPIDHLEIQMGRERRSR